MCCTYYKFGCANVEHVCDFKTGFKNMLRSIFKQSRERYMKYKKMCNDTNSVCLGPNWDVPTRWNSTFNMFQSALKQKDTLKIYHDHLTSRGRAIPFPEEGWVCIEDMTELLEVFNNATTQLSGVYYPTSPFVLHNLYLMARKLKEYEDKNEMFSAMVAPMKLKFKKYFKEIPPVFTCAAFLNPCYNVAGVESVIDRICSDLALYEEDVFFANNTISCLYSKHV
jgi:hypothetical protein